MKPFSCTETQLTGAFWLSSNLYLLELDYTIGSTIPVETFKFTSLYASCSFEIKVYEYDTATSTWIDHVAGEVSYAEDTSNVLIARFIYDVTFFSSDLSYDDGLGLTGSTKNYKISVAAPDHATANSASNP